MTAKNLTTGAQSAAKFPTDDLTVDWSRNSRGRNVPHLCTLIASIYANGLQVSPTVTVDGSRRNPVYYVGPGFHRAEAVKVLRHGPEAIVPCSRYTQEDVDAVREQVAGFLALHQIPTSGDFLPELLCYVDEFSGDNSLERTVQQLVENMHREDATQAEIADGVRELKRLGLDRHKIAARLVRDVQWVDRALMFGKHATEELVEANRDGEIPNTLAVEAAREDPETQREIVADVKAGKAPRAAVDKARGKRGKGKLRKRPSAGALRKLFEDQGIEVRVKGPKPETDNDATCSAVCRGIAAGIIYALGVSDMEPEKLARQNKGSLIDLLDEALGRGAWEGKASGKTGKAKASKTAAKPKPAGKKKGGKKSGSKKKGAAAPDSGSDGSEG